MAKKYCEFVVEGSFDFIRGFVLGFFEGRGIQGDAVFEREHHVEHETKFGQLLRMIRIKENHAYLIVDSEVHGMIQEAIEKRNLKNDIKIVSMREITQAYFEFSYHIYSRTLGEELKTFFGSLPPGLRIEKGDGPKETVNPEGKGIEAYTPLHEYEIEAKGEIHGPVGVVLNLYSKIEHKDMVELGNIKLAE